MSGIINPKYTLKYFKVFLLRIFVFASVGTIQANCQSIEVRWELLENSITNPESHRALFEIRNTSESELESGWKLYFNTIVLSVCPEVKESNFRIKSLSGDFYVLEGNEETPSIKSKESIIVEYQSKTPFLKNSYAPEGLILKKSDGSFFEIKQYEAGKMSRKAFSDYTSFLPVPTPEWIFDQNQGISLRPLAELPPFLPIPKKWNYTGDPLLVRNAGLVILGDQVFGDESKFLTSKILKRYQPVIDKNEKPIQIRISRKEGIPAEGYRLELRERRVLILASDSAGVFYGIQAFLALMPADFWQNASDQLVLPQVEIEDYPSYSYRGFFMDVAKNFQPKSQILKILDLMAFYKLNKFHFNLAGDEGWRLEIPGLSELTDYASKRGFSIDESEMLWPFYASGSSVENSSGTGFYSVEDFKEILNYAKDRHIEVIPEFGLPTYSRAAIKAMEKRFDRYTAEGKENQAQEFRLSDPGDQSAYLSAQKFRDNTVCVCQESTYVFYEKLIDEVKRMYESVQSPLQVWNVGGGGVPIGAWLQSPVCQSFVMQNPELSMVDLEDYFRERIGKILASKGLLMMVLDEEIGQILLKDTGNEHSDSKYPRVINSIAHFNFGQAYDPDEGGSTCVGVSDLYAVWKTVPVKLNLTHSQEIVAPNQDGWGVAKGEFPEKEKINMLGLVGGIGSETVKSPEMLEYYLFPKMLGFVERTWNADSAASEKSVVSEMGNVSKKEWNIFTNVVGQIEMVRLETIFGGVKMRIPKAGVKRIGQQLHANVQSPGLIIRYTLDGTDPDENSAVYSGPIPFNSKARFRVFSKKGLAGEVSGY